MKVGRIFVCYKVKKSKAFKTGTRGICPLEYFDCNEMKPLHLVKNKKEAMNWLMKLHVAHFIESAY